MVSVASMLSGLVFCAACASRPAGPQIAGCPTPTDPELARAVMAALPAELPEGEPTRGTALFEVQCQRCHADDTRERSSRLFRAYPRLSCGDWQASVSDRYLHAAIASGGERIGKQKVMAAFSETLGPQQIADLVAFLRTLPEPVERVERAEPAEAAAEGAGEAAGADR